MTRARSLVQGGFKYTLNRPGREGQTYWQCADMNSPGRGVTDENNHLVSTNNNHCYPPNDVEIKVAKVLERMKQLNSSSNCWSS